MRIGKRLEKILEIIPNKLGRVVDVGTDHGFLALKMIEEKNVKEVFATDISAPSLEKARLLAEKYGLTDRLKTVVSDGFKSLDNGDFDLAVIAGMGGNETIKILKDAYNLKRFGSFILQPMQDVDILRRYLFETGFEIYFDETVKDRNKFYSIIKCKFVGKPKNYELIDIFIGKTDKNNKGPDFIEYLNFEISALKGREKYLSDVDKARIQLYNEIMLDKK